MTFGKAVRAIAKDRHSRRRREINSGGTVSASDSMWRTLSRLSRKKQVVVNIKCCCLGGYYTAVGAPKIYANEQTLTGSIGVFAGKFNNRLLTKWGVVNQTYMGYSGWSSIGNNGME